MNVLKKVYICAFNPGKYYILIREKLSKAVGYLILLTLVTGIISYIRPAFDYYKFMTLVESEINNDFPEFVLHNGVLDVKEEEPIIITKENKPPIIIDTSGKTSVSVMNNYRECILILRKEVYYKKDGGKIDKASFELLDDMYLDKKKTQESIPMLKNAAFLIIFLAPALNIILNLFLALTVSLAGIMFNCMIQCPLTYKTIYKISIYSLTSSIVLGAILKGSELSISFRYYVFIFLGAVYVIIAIIKGLNKITENIE
ncbi:MAG: DUF1189 domain-containing protein [Clostridiaceae bacterium]